MTRSKPGMVRVGNRDPVQVISASDPTPSFFPVPPPGAIIADQTGFPLDGGGTMALIPPETLFGDIFPPAVSPGGTRENQTPAMVAPRSDHPLKSGVPRRFTTQSLPEEFAPTEEDCARRFIVSTVELLDILRGRLQVQRTTLAVFTGALQTEFSFAAIAPEELAIQAQRILRSDPFDSEALWEAPVARLTAILHGGGFPRRTSRSG